jgi:hypothetical protein
LAGTQTNKLKKLAAAADEWNRQLIPPAFPGLAGHHESPVEP